MSMLRKGWLGGFGLIVAIVWAGCANSTAPGPQGLSRPEATVVREVAPSPTADEPKVPTVDPATPNTPTVPPTLQPTEIPPTPIVPTPTQEVEKTAPEATPPASAEGSAPPSQSRSVVTPAPYTPQPLPLHPFQPAKGRVRVVAIDPGHGGPEVGAAGAGVAEKDVNLAIALKLRQLLEQDGMRVVLTRDGDRRAYSPDGLAPEGNSATRADLQNRIDIANKAQADAFISIHNNSSGDTTMSGTEVWWDGKRPFGVFNEALAEDVLASLIEAIRGTGYPVVERGTKEDSQFRIYQGQAFPLFLLGPPRTGTTNTRAAQMPSVLGETLFLSNPTEAWQLTRDAVRTAIAKGYRDGLQNYFKRIDSGALDIPPGGLPAEKPNYYNLRPPGGEQR